MTLRRSAFPDDDPDPGDQSDISPTLQVAIKDLENKRGRLSADGYVRHAASKSSPLHSSLCWDDAAAGHQWRLEQARHILRRYRFMVLVEDVEVMVPRYVRDPEADGRGEQGYVSMEQIATESENAVSLVAYEIRRAKGSLERAMAIGQALEIRKDVKRVLDQVSALLSKVS